MLLNKWELLDAEQRLDIATRSRIGSTSSATRRCCKICAQTGKGVHKLLPALPMRIEDYHRRVPTREVNEVDPGRAVGPARARRARVLYATQGAADPPTFTLFANRELPPTYLRYLEGRLRDDLDLGSTPVKLRVRRRS